MKLTIEDRELDNLRLGGAPLPQFKSLVLEPKRINAKAGNGKVRSLSPDKQLALYKKFAGQMTPDYTFCISSEVNDSNAKFVAAHWYASWIKNYRKLSMDPKFGYGKPRWHTLTGGFKDDLRDNVRHGRNKPCAIVLANLTNDSTPLKLEKVRDLLDLYYDIPRLVVITGEDPVTFFNEKLKYPLNGAVLLGTKSARSRVSESI